MTTTPKTAAGRALLEEAWAPLNRRYLPANAARLTDAILAIEAEARQAAPLDVLDGERKLQVHDNGCRCWPHVSERDAIEAIVAVARAEYRSAAAYAATAKTPAPVDAEEE
jgi:hypothetical protein